MTAHALQTFRVGQEVEVLPLTTILQTVDAMGSTEGLPFMPEMVRFCGSRHRIASQVHQSCVEGTGMRRLTDTFILENVRCDGAAHEDCDKVCAILWRGVWLRGLPPETASHTPAPPREETIAEPPTTLPVRRSNGTYHCQSTQLASAGQPLRKWDPRRWYQGVIHRGLDPGSALRMLVMPFARKVLARIPGGTWRPPRGDLVRTPEATLGLQPGERVEVRSLAEILTTLDAEGRNRGLQFTPPMVPFCGRSSRVVRRVDRIIDEATGRVVPIRNTVLLERSTCDGHTVCGGCPRDAYHLWREIWLKRVSTP